MSESYRATQERFRVSWQVNWGDVILNKGKYNRAERKQYKSIIQLNYYYTTFCDIVSMNIMLLSLLVFLMLILHGNLYVVSSVQSHLRGQNSPVKTKVQENGLVTCIKRINWLPGYSHNDTHSVQRVISNVGTLGQTKPTKSRGKIGLQTQQKVLTKGTFIVSILVGAVWCICVLYSKVACC